MSALNNVEIIGRLGSDLELRYSQGENATAFGSVSVAVQRPFKNKETDQYDVDWIRCQFSGATAEFVSKYFHKGDGIALRGWLKTGSYEKNGVTIYTTDVKAEDVSFLPVRKSDTEENSNKQDNGFKTIEPDDAEALPFQ